MTSWRVHPATAPLAGQLRVPSDKSISHRSVLLAGIATGTSTLSNPLQGEDVRASLRAMAAFGATYKENDGVWEITGCAGNLQSPPESIDCGNAGTLMRLLAGLVCGRNISCVLDGDASLRARPMRRISEPLAQMGAVITPSETGTPPLVIETCSSLAHVKYTLPKASAQIKSAVLLAGLCAEGGATVIEPQICRDHTEKILPLFGAKVSRDGNSITVEKCAQLQATDIDIPADISSAAFFLVAASIVPESELVLRDVCVNPTRTGVIDLLQRMGASIASSNERMLGAEPVADLTVKASQLQAIDITAADVPAAIDELPVLMVAASIADGTTTISGASELRAKESDRLAAMARALAVLGVKLVEHPDGIEITGGKLGGGEVDSQGDHRIAMAMAVAALVADGAITVRDTTNVNTSFPDFERYTAEVAWKIEPV